MTSLQNFNFFALYLLFIFFTISFIRQKHINKIAYIIVGSFDIFQFFFLEKNLLNAIFLLFFAILFYFLQCKIIKINLTTNNNTEYLKLNDISNNIIFDRFIKSKNISKNIKLIENFAIYKNNFQKINSTENQLLNDKIIKIEKQLEETQYYLSSFIDKMDETFTKLNELSKKKVF